MTSHSVSLENGEDNDDKDDDDDNDDDDNDNNNNNNNNNNNKGTNGTGESYWNIKCVSISSPIFVRNISTKKWARYDQKCTLVFM